MKTTEVNFLRLSDYEDIAVAEAYEKISNRFICLEGEKLSKRKESLLGRLLLYRTLENRGAGEFEVRYKDAEKPRLISDKGLFFNISHSGDFVVTAVSDDEVGCDVQEIRPYNPKVARRHYCPEEMKLIEGSDSRDDGFIRLWALKESILKFTGKGISAGLATYDFSPYINEDSFEAFGVKFAVKKIENAYFALCHKGEDIILKGEKLNELNQVYKK